jgi:Flp pilus assembly protein TadD
VAIDDSVFVYQGTFAVPEISAVSRAQQSETYLEKKQPGSALVLAREAVAIAPENLFAETALGNAAAASGDKQTAERAWLTAIGIAQHLEPDAQSSYIPDLESKIKRLSGGKN